MVNKKWIIIILFMVSTFCFSATEEVIRVKEKILTKKIILITGNYFSEHMTGILTQNGVIVVDTLTTSTSTRKGYKLIKKHFKQPVKVLINTHFDIDHYGGNQEMSESLIIAHENCKNHFDEILFADINNKKEIERFIHQTEKKIISFPAESKQHKKLQFYINNYRRLLPGWKNFKFTPPSLYFNDEIQLGSGKDRVIISYLGPGHTNGDIVVFIPDQRIIISGDLILGKNYLPVIHKQHGGSLRGLISILQHLFSYRDRYDVIVPGHGSPDDFSIIKKQLRYLMKLQNEVQIAVKKRYTLAQTRKKIILKEYCDLFLYDFVHSTNLEIAWIENQ